MVKSSRIGWTMLLTVNILLWFALVMHEPSGAAPAPANPAVQRDAIVAELTEIKRLLSEQNQLLKSGKVTAVVARKE